MSLGASGLRANASHKELAGYELLSELGRGGMGLVYLAREPGLEREVALKTLEPGAVRRGHSSGILSVLQARFVQEAKVTGRLQHPGVVPIYRMGKDSEGRHFYTMRPITEGRTLKEVLSDLASGDPEASSRWAIRHLVEMLRTVCLTLAYVHDRGVVHRDLKPSNIVVGDYGEVLVIDWGLAKVRGTAGAERERRGMEREDRQPGRQAGAVEVGQVGSRSNIQASDETPQLTLDGEILGTPAYMPPEQARGDAGSISPASDIYALGAILYELLTLTPPYVGKDVMAVLDAAASGRGTEDPQERAPERDIPEDLISVARKAMDSSPENRYGTAREMADDLSAWLDGVSRWRVVDRLDLARLDAKTHFTSLGSSNRRFSVEGGLLRFGRGESILLYNRRFTGALRISCTAWCEGPNPAELSLILCARDPEQVRTGGADGYCLQFGGKALRCLNIARHQHDVLQIPDMAPETGRKYELVAEASNGEVSLAIDGEEVVRWRDPSPLSSGHVGFYGYGRGACFSNVVVETLGKPVRVSVLETPNAYFDDGMYDRALRMYREIAESHPHRIEGIRAAFKAGLCLMNVGDVAAAGEAFRRMQDGPGSKPLGVLGMAQLLEREQNEAAACEFLLSRARGMEAPSPRWMEVAIHAFERARAHAADAGRADGCKAGLFDKWFESALRLAPDQRELAARANPRYFRQLHARWLKQHVALAGDVAAALSVPDLTLDAIKTKLFWSGLDLEPGMLLTIGSELHRRQRWGTARSVLYSLLRESSDDEDLGHAAMRAIARTWVDTLHFSKGLECYEKAVNDHAVSPRQVSDTMKDCAEASWFAGRYDDAFRRFMKIAGGRRWRRAISREALLSAGLVLLARRDLEGALEHFTSLPTRVRGHTSSSAMACVYAGLTLQLMGREQEARATYERCRSEYAHHSAASLSCVLEGMFLRRRGDHVKAVERFRAALEMRSGPDENRARALVEMGHTYIRMGRCEDALEAVGRCVEEHGGKWEGVASAELLVAHVSRVEGRYPEALEKYRSLAESRHPPASLEASLWAGLVESRLNSDLSPLDSDHFRGVALAPMPASGADMTARNWWAIALMGDPLDGEADSRWEAVFREHGVGGWLSTGTGLWLTDDCGVPVTPEEALRRSGPIVRERFEAMLGYRASFDPAWGKFAACSE